MRWSAVRISFFALATLVAVPLVARAQSAEDLVAKNLAARGGAAKLAAISSIKFTGKMIEPGDFELGFVSTLRRKDDAALLQESVQGLTLTQGYDGKTGWRINPFEGRRDAERMSSDDAQALADDSTIDGQLLSAHARGSTVTYLGREDFEGTDTYKLRVKLPSGVEYLYNLDPDTYLEIRILETRELRGARQIQMMELGDYELVDGVYFPFSIESGPPDGTPDQLQKLVIEHADANVAAGDSIFMMPPSPGAAK